MVKHFYREVARLPKISDQEMGIVMENLSEQQNDGFDTISALKELYIYVTKYRDQVCWIMKCIMLNYKLNVFNCLDPRRSRQ